MKSILSYRTEEFTRTNEWTWPSYNWTRFKASIPYDLVATYKSEITHYTMAIRIRLIRLGTLTRVDVHTNHAYHGGCTQGWILRFKEDFESLYGAKTLFNQIQNDITFLFMESKL